MKVSFISFLVTFVFIAYGRTQDLCDRPPILGHCNIFQDVFVYDYFMKECKRVGLKCPKGNIFNTKERCEEICGRTQDVCDRPPILGHCNIFQDVFVYDSFMKECKRVGLQCPIGNIFQTKEKCEETCGRTQNLCHLKPILGHCNIFQDVFVYDPFMQECKRVGLQCPTGNIFNTKQRCEEICGRKQDVCGPPILGQCNILKDVFVYDSTRMECKRVGLACPIGNTFNTKEKCEETCVRITNL